MGPSAWTNPILRELSSHFLGRDPDRLKMSKNTPNVWEGTCHGFGCRGCIKWLLDLQRQGGILSKPRCPRSLNTLCLEGIDCCVSLPLFPPCGGRVSRSINGGPVPVLNLTCQNDCTMVKKGKHFGILGLHVNHFVNNKLCSFVAAKVGAKLFQPSSKSCSWHVTQDPQTAARI